MHLRPGHPDDIPLIMAIERLPTAHQFVGQWSEDRHRSTLTGTDARYFVSEAGSGKLRAYAILRGLSEDSGAVELKRIVVATPERGLGRQMLTELIQIVFEDLHAHRLFLDVYEDNARACHLYESLGFLRRCAARRRQTRRQLLQSPPDVDARKQYRARKTATAAPKAP